MKNLKAFNEAQMKEIDIYKWVESEKAGKDLGNICVCQWIKENGARFRELYFFGERK